ncbi:hypothetical protein KQX54_017046 [Cotesia glomerata]|uniref:Uncharacterized protein n=1 Tax=Cotesia glomerata TaxID=32391 RepID=A0AAV7J6S3_COTGL|nr:hypothetical protein KQX54_017046 [Cotesia glomerata]
MSETENTGTLKKRGYQTRSKSQQDIRDFTFAFSPIPKIRMEEDKRNNESGGFVNEMNETLKQKEAEASLAGNESMKNGTEDGKSGDKTKTQLSNGSHESTLTSTDYDPLDGADGVRFDDWQIDMIAERVSQKMYEEGKRRDIGWERLLNRALDEIGDLTKRSVEMAKKEICAKISQEAGELTEKECEACKNAQEREIMLRENIRKKLRTYEKERKKKHDKQPMFDNASYVTKETTEELARSAEDGAFANGAFFNFRSEWVNERQAKVPGNNMHTTVGNIGQRESKIMEPRKLNETELREELIKREERKNNIFIRHKCKSNAEAVTTIEEKTNEVLDNARQEKNAKGIILMKFSDKESKLKIMKKRYMLKGTEIFLDDDMTERERKRWQNGLEW